MKKRRLTAVVLLIAILFAAIGCSSPKDVPDDSTEQTTTATTEVIVSGDTIPVIENGKTSYQIVFANAGKSAGVNLQSKLKKNFGVNLAYSFDSTADPNDENAKEIVVGSTNRGQSEAKEAALRFDDYLIYVEGNRIYILGGSNDARDRAVEFFLKEFTKEGNLTVYTNVECRYSGTYSYDSLTLNGLPIQDYVLIGSDAKTLYNAIMAATGYKLPTVDESYDGDAKAIVTGNSSYKKGKDYKQEAYYSDIRIEDGDIYLTYDAEMVGNSVVIKAFLTALNLNSDGSLISDVRNYAVTSSALTLHVKSEIQCEIATDAILAEIDAKTDKLKAEILSSTDTIQPATGKTAYYVSNDGNDSNDGKSPENAWATLSKVSSMTFKTGDVVYFRRGDLFRGTLTARPGVTYCAYGVGEKPILCGSPYNGAVTGTWDETDTPNVYRYSIPFTADVGLLVFNDGESYAIKIIPEFSGNTPVSDHALGIPFTSYRDLPGDLFFYHDLGQGTSSDSVAEGCGYLYLYSAEGNPADRFDRIEFNRKGTVVNVRGDRVKIDNLHITYGGSHGVGAGSVSKLTVTNCEINWIGGSIQFFSDGIPVRFGNGVEIYGSCSDYTVSHNYIHDIYDAGITHQCKGTGSASPYIMENILYSENLLVNCIYSIEYFNEQPDNSYNMMRNVTIENNIMRCAGGFGWQRPDKVARHIQGGWLGCVREYPAKNFVIRNNIFDRSCDVLLSISSTKESDIPLLKGNTYIQKVGKNFGYVGIDYTKYDVYNQSIVQTLVALRESDAKVILIEDDVKTTYPEDTRVNALVRAATKK